MPQPSPTHLGPFDLTIVAFYLIGITLFGLRFREKKSAPAAPGTPQPDRSLKSYFLANNTIPWWAIALSIVSAETSTLTIISIPGVAFAGDFGFLQIVLGYMLGRIVVALLFLPRYFAGEMLTAYQLIDQRFGHTLHKVTAGLFLLTRAAAEGVRVFAVSIVVGIAIGTGDTLSIAIITVLTLLYTFEGGMAAVIWTDVVQMAIYVAGTLVAVWSIGHHIPGGWATIVPIASAAGKFHLFNFALNLTTAYTFWAGILGGTFLTMASHGTDQLMVQRMLSARSLRESRLALLSSGVVIFIQFTLFLLIGAGLYVFYGQHPTTFSGTDRIFPTFIVHELPLGIAGLLVAAILAAAMSNLSAALNSLSSTTVVDFYMQLRPAAADRERNIIAKSSTVLWALVLFAIAVATVSVGGKGHVVEIALSIASVAYGCLLGVFLLGTLTKFATEIGATLGMICGFALNLWLWQGTFPKKFFATHCTNPFPFKDCPTPYAASTFPPFTDITIPHIAFTWYVLIGALVTFAIGALASLIFRKQSKRTATVAAALLYLFVFPFRSVAEEPASPGSPQTSGGPPVPLHGTGGYNFTPITTLLNDAIAAHKLPGAVVLIGHNNHIVFEQAYGNRKLANEPGLDGKPSPAEPMTEDTIFDMASLTKCLATATAVMQLYEQGKIASFDDPLVKYLPEFAASNPSSSPAPNPASFATSSNPASGTSANGAAISQPRAQPWVTTQEKKQRAEGPTQNSATFDKSKVTIRMLLTHTSGEAPDVDLRDPWGLAAPDRAEGLHRALTTPLKATPGSIFTYSDINFILLGDLVETLSGQREDVYVAEKIFKPLGMDQTGYHAFDKTCSWLSESLGSAIVLNRNYQFPPASGVGCGGGPGNWSLFPPAAPTAHDNEGTAATNPDFDHLLRGTVHDPTTRRMGGVAGHAGVFSTAHDISLYASALLQKLRDNTGPFPLKQSTLQLMTQPEQPSTTGSTAFNSDLFTASQLRAANQAQAYAIADGAKPSEPGLAPHYPAMKGVNLRGYGWDIDTAFSKPRGAIFPIGSFGHTGFTGTSLWMDPASDTYVILLANAIHPRGNPPISNLRGQIATAAAKALRLDVYYELKAEYKERLANDDLPTHVILSEGAGPHPAPQSKDPASVHPTSTVGTLSTTEPQPLTLDPEDQAKLDKAIVQSQTLSEITSHTLTGIDVLESTNFAALNCKKSSQLASSQPTAGNQPPSSTLDPSPLTPVQTPPSSTCHKNLGILTNQTGLDSLGHRTIDILHALPSTVCSLLSVFTPEHGLSGTLDREGIASTVDSATHLPVISLYGKPADRRPTHDQLKDLDAVLVDLQDAGVHFWTYEAATGYFLEAAALEKSQYHHDLELILLDRPNPLGGIQAQGPLSDPGSESYVNYMPLPIRHGLTLGELMRYANATKHLNAHLTVVPMQHWSRTQLYADTGLPQEDGKLNLSPNLRSVEAALRYPALGLIETTNLSVGRGTDHPFSFFGAGASTASRYPEASASGLIGPGKEKGALAPGVPWFNATTVADALNDRHLPGVTFAATRVPIAEDENHYPYHGQTIPAVKLLLTDPTLADTPEIGIEILSALHKLYPTQFNLDRAKTLLCSQSTLDALKRGDDPRAIAATWQPALEAFRTATKPFLLY